MKVKFLWIAALYFYMGSLFAQPANQAFKAVDDYAKSVGSLDTLNAGTISYVLTKKFPNTTDKVRAIFTWIALNISFDVKQARNNGNEKITSDIILKTRKTTSTGYATLFQDMCSVNKIRCLTVDGYAKYTVEEMWEKPDQFNHTWVVVQLGQSPDTWEYVDPTWGSGYTDEKMTNFTRQFNDAYFFANKQLFNYQHYPDNTAWLLGPGPKSLKDFLNLPMIKHQAYDFRIGGVNPNNGILKAKPGSSLSFSFAASGSIDIVALQMNIGKKTFTKTVDHQYSSGRISFAYKFTEEDSYPVTILLNNKPVLAYWATIEE
jgi:transglutaminase/protease-like cytokinesis protein 3